ncbi:hypothetical protein OV450_8529, partial [Actinobacteria bacterium OV450]
PRALPPTGPPQIPPEVPPQKAHRDGSRRPGRGPVVAPVGHPDPWPSSRPVTPRAAPTPRPRMGATSLTRVPRTARAAHLAGPSRDLNPVKGWSILRHTTQANHGLHRPRPPHAPATTRPPTDPIPQPPHRRMPHRNRTHTDDTTATKSVTRRIRTGKNRSASDHDDRLTEHSKRTSGRLRFFPAIRRDTHLQASPSSLKAGRVLPRPTGAVPGLPRW